MIAAARVDRVARTVWVVTVPVFGRERLTSAGIVIPVTALAGWARTPLTAWWLGRRLHRQARTIEQEG